MSQLEILCERDRLGQRLDDERLEDHIRHWFAGEGDTGDDLREQIERDLWGEGVSNRKLSSRASLRQAHHTETKHEHVPPVRTSRR